MYTVVLYLHILGFAIWFGAVLTGTLVWRRRVRGGDPMAATEDWRSIDRYLTEPSAAVVLLAGGYLMSAGDFAFDENIWIHIGFAALVASVLVSIFGVGFARRAATKGGELTARLAARALWSSVVAGALILVGLWAMVARPTF
jgi:hypothetical protein